MGSGNQHGNRDYDDLQNWLNMTSHKKTPYLVAEKARKLRGGEI